MSGTFDYVIIGAGSAGCVLANRLSADGARVLLLEAGGRNSSMNVSMPAGMASVVTGQNAMNWGFTTDPIPGFGGRTLYQARGRGWGGSSSINGMLYVRGNASDYDEWAQLGLRGWSFDDVLPYFRKMEDAADGDEGFHGRGGPLHVERGRSKLPIYQAFIDAAAEAGFPRTDDFNGARQEGFGRYQLNIRDGRRAGALASYLKPALSRPNLETRTDAHVTRILVEEGRAVGVEYARGPDAPREQVRAEREVIVSAGAFQSPQILQLSGIGDPALLRELGIAQQAALPGVGENLQDHVDVSVNYRSKLPLLHSLTQGWRKLAIGIEYLVRRTGLAAENALEAGGFIRSRPELERPDIQVHFIPGVMVNHGEKGLAPFDGYSINVVPLHPESRGAVSIGSADPFAPPRLRPNFLATEGDMRTMRTAARLGQLIGRQPALAPWCAEEIEPAGEGASDDTLDAWIRANSATVFHPVGTCRMGRADDPRAVVDPQLRVRGVEGLRVADASVMPTIVSGNTNAATYMIAEKAADMILAARR